MLSRRGIKRIGIAGYMGAGKSTCAMILSEALKSRAQRVRIIDADYEAKLLMQNDPVIIKNLVELFGDEIIVHDAIDFSTLGTKVFRSEEMLCALNKTVHPNLVQKLHAMVFATDDSVVICDAALIALWQVEKWFDVLMWVAASKEKRLKRLCKKTGICALELTMRMQMQQALFAEPVGNGWLCIKNNGSARDIEKQVRVFLETIT